LARTGMGTQTGALRQLENHATTANIQH